MIPGNPHVLNQDPMWHEILDHCVKNKAYVGCDLPEMDLASEMEPYPEEAVEPIQEPQSVPKEVDSPKTDYTPQELEDMEFGTLNHMVPPDTQETDNALCQDQPGIKDNQCPVDSTTGSLKSESEPISIEEINRSNEKIESETDEKTQRDELKGDYVSVREREDYIRGITCLKNQLPDQKLNIATEQSITTLDRYDELLEINKTDCASESDAKNVISLNSPSNNETKSNSEQEHHTNDSSNFYVKSHTPNVEALENNVKSIESTCDRKGDLPQENAWWPSDQDFIKDTTNSSIGKSCRKSLEDIIKKKKVSTEFPKSVIKSYPGSPVKKKNSTRPKNASPSKRSKKPETFLKPHVISKADTSINQSNAQETESYHSLCYSPSTVFDSIPNQRPVSNKTHENSQSVSSNRSSSPEQNREYTSTSLEYDRPMEQASARRITTPNVLEKKIIQQMEYYFGDVNLIKDAFLKNAISKDRNGCILF